MRHSFLGPKAILVGGIVALYIPFFLQIVPVWNQHPYAGHGVFALLFAGALVWLDRSALMQLPVEPNRRGMVVAAGGLLLYGIGLSTHNLYLQGLSFPTTLSGAILWLYGAPCLRALMYPLGLLVLMLPLPGFIVRIFSEPLIRFAAWWTSAALSVLQIPHFHLGSTLELPALTLEVIEGCNGLRFLMALFTLSAALAYVTQRTRWRTFWAVVAAIPIAIGANATRVAAIAVASYYLGPGAASGTPHLVIGKVLWILMLIPIGLIHYGLRRHGSGREEHDTEPQESLVMPGNDPRPRWSTHS